jgi:DNA-binding NarL/FixJ family response regulator
VIVTSTMSDPETRRRVIELGALAFLPKPVNADELARLVGGLRASSEGSTDRAFAASPAQLAASPA